MISNFMFGQWRKTVRTAIVALAIALVLVIVFLYFLPNLNVAKPLPPQPADVPSVIVLAGPAYAYPNRDLTPGAIDTAVTEDNIQSTICVPGYTKTVRPPERFTNRLKLQIIAAYGLGGDLRDYELDHFIPLELGGCPDCISNLWPEPYGTVLGAKQKDRVENFLHRQVCSGEISLKDAQGAITGDWVRVYNQIALDQ
jgi:hypothetical protein